MKRSHVNDIIAESDAFMKSFGFTLPPFAYWSPEQLKARVASDSPTIFDARLGWDITDYGKGRFDEFGLVLFTLRNGNARPDGSVDEESDVVVATDARLRTLKAGDLLKLKAGESVTLLPGNWHAFWAEGADVLMGEVSTVNDDLTDNYFREPVGRFSAIEEDAGPAHLLVSDYDTWLR
jgi:D-lyxose ketol-isomerase